jgi:hypothetical protein
VSIRDIDKALNYLSDHWMDKYCPHIESGQTFREKYLKLTNQMDKPNKPQIKQSEPIIESKPKTYNSTNDWYDCETINRFDD